MKASSRRTAMVACVLMSAVAACSEKEEPSPQPAPAKTETTRQPKTPPMPQMPAGWEVVEDHLFAVADLVPLERKLGAELTGLRNTTFAVDGKKLKVNTLVAADAAHAEALMKNITATKPAEFLLRRGLYVYEFVCANDAIPHARAGRKHLAATE